MIARHWRGLAQTRHADAYIEHLRTETFPALERLGGFRRASILRRDVEDGVEFLVVTEWDSVAAIRSFAGADSEAAVVPPEVRALMIACDERARHYVVVP
jgi:heme-degrading monooxygenase HmoA